MDGSLGVTSAWMWSTGDRMVVVDSSVAIIRAMFFFGDVVVLMVDLHSKGLFRTLLRFGCAYDVYRVVIFRRLLCK